MIKVTNPNTLLLRDSIGAGLAQDPIIRKKYFVSLNAINLGIGSDRVENVLCGAINLPLPSFVQNTVVQCGTNKISTDSPRDIADCIDGVHCRKRVRIRSYSGPHFPAFGLNT